ncbi:hypothetical protein SVA_2703 [Sulfurifustis variabilis]|uniref:Uncharacterized protein n=1 Tax=Sulfurifustis variabilis TaxID=1675686 RepID=A0A1B4VCG8_9GAMM|nr:hypothetical protein SVA_2703 [Sulfurifustis variabilis]
MRSALRKRDRRFILDHAIVAAQTGLVGSCKAPLARFARSVDTNRRPAGRRKEVAPLFRATGTIIDMEVTTMRSKHAIGGGGQPPNSIGGGGQPNDLIRGGGGQPPRMGGGGQPKPTGGGGQPPVL